MSKKIYVGNLSFDSTEEKVRELFEQYGSVEDIAWITDRDSGRFRGFAFVQMDDASAAEAIKSVDGQEFDGRSLKVNEAKPRTEGSRGGNRGRGGYNNRW